jgi:hypothetical protein
VTRLSSPRSLHWSIALGNVRAIFLPISYKCVNGMWPGSVEIALRAVESIG